MKNFLTVLLFKTSEILILFSPFLAYSAGGEFSFKAIFIQAFNFSLFLFFFLFLVRKPLQAFFHKRQKDFFAFEKHALKLEEEKQAEQKLWERKLLGLKTKEENIHKQAQEEGKRFKEQKQRELEELSARLRKSSAFLLNLEREKLKRESFNRWKTHLLEKVETDLKRLALSEEFQKKEQEGFLNLLQRQKRNKKRRA